MQLLYTLTTSKRIQGLTDIPDKGSNYWPHLNLNYSYQQVQAENVSGFTRMATVIRHSTSARKGIFSGNLFNTYRHFYTNWYYRAEATAMYKNRICSFEIQNHRNDLYGETLNFGENYHRSTLMYKHKSLTAGIITLNPFVDNWKMGSENRNQHSPSKNWQYIKESSRLFVLTLAWNFSFGREYKAVEKRLNNEDNNSGVMN